VSVALAFGVAAAAPVGFDEAAAWWRMDNNANDSNAPPASDGTVTGSLNYVPAAGAGYRSSGTAAQFSGNDRIAFSTAPGTELDTNWSTGLTAFARVKLDGLSNSEELLNRDGYTGTAPHSPKRGFGLATFNGRGPAWRLWSGNSEARLLWEPGYPSQLTTGAYHDLVGVFRPGSSTELYLDGKLILSDSTGFASLNTPPGVDVMAGRRSGGGSPGWFSGDMESAALWDQALSPRDVRRLTVGDRSMDQRDAVAWYRFDGNYNDSSGAPFSNGSPRGGVSLAPTPSAPGYLSNGQSARFDGGDYVLLGTGDRDELNLDGSTGLTVFARVRQTSASGDIASRDAWYVGNPTRAQERAWSISTSGSSGPHFRVWDGTTENRAQGPTGYPDGYFDEWHDIVGVFRPGQKVEIWMDGQAIATTPTSFTRINTPVYGGPIGTGNNVPILLGWNVYNHSNYFHGDMESAAMWNYDLDVRDIRRLTSGDKVGTHHDAVVWYRFGGDFSDANGPTLTNGRSPHSRLPSIVAEPSAPNHMGNDTIARFNGVNNYIHLGEATTNDDELNLDGATGLTIFARVRQNATGGMEIISRDGYNIRGSNLDRAFAIDTWGGGGPVLRLWSGTTENRTPADPNGLGYPDEYIGQWHDLVGVFRPGEALELWMDGELYAMSLTSFTSLNTPTLQAYNGTDNFLATYIGRRFPGPYTTDGYFNGDIESVAFWNYALMPHEIVMLSVPEPTTLSLLALGGLGLVARWRRKR